MSHKCIIKSRFTSDTSRACSQQAGSGMAARAVFAPQPEDAAVQLHVGLVLHVGSAALKQQVHSQRHQLRFFV